MSGSKACRYRLFGHDYSVSSRRDVVRRVLDELYRRDPENLRSCIGFVWWLRSDPSYWPSGMWYEVAKRLWAWVQWPEADTLEPVIHKLFDEMECSREHFRVLTT